MLLTEIYNLQGSISLAVFHWRMNEGWENPCFILDKDTHLCLGNAVVLGLRAGIAQLVER